MPYSNISSLYRARVESCSYFLDANVWIYALQQFESLKNWQSIYYDFFYDIIDSNLSNKPKILLPSLLLSEIVNTYLRDIAIPEYKRSNSIPDNQTVHFKNEYRKTQHYQDSYERLMDDIYSFKSSIDFIDDRTITNHVTLLKQDIATFDFNDYLYYSLCIEISATKRVVIVTNDGDFAVKDIEIVTLNQSLLRL